MNKIRKLYGKKIKTTIKLQIKAGQANPAPPVGPALGQHGVNIQDFVQNSMTQQKIEWAMLFQLLLQFLKI